MGGMLSRGFEESGALDVLSMKLKDDRELELLAVGIGDKEQEEEGLLALDEVGIGRAKGLSPTGTSAVWMVALMAAVWSTEERGATALS